MYRKNTRNILKLSNEKRTKDYKFTNYTTPKITTTHKIQQKHPIRYLQYISNNLYYIIKQIIILFLAKKSQRWNRRNTRLFELLF